MSSSIATKGIADILVSYCFLFYIILCALMFPLHVWICILRSEEDISFPEMGDRSNYEMPCKCWD